MNRDDIRQWLKLSVSGDRQARENLISFYRSFVLREAQKVCRRSLRWGQDEELSVALIAFDESIDAYGKSEEGSFEQLSRLIIRRRLVDYFRRVNRNNLVALPGHDSSLEPSFEEDWERSQRKSEVESYRRSLAKFNITFDMLVKAQPTHRDTRNKLRQTARILAENDGLMEDLKKYGRLPQGKLCRLTNLTPRVLERGRIYIIALAILLSDDNLPHLREYATELTAEGDK